MSAGPPSGDDQPWRRLSGRMLLVHPVREVARAVPALLGLLVAGSARGQGELWSLAGVGLAVVIGTLRWFTTTYRVRPDQVELHRGLLRRRTLTIPLDRVRTVDVTANLMHRLLGLARVEIGTGRTVRESGGRESGGGLSLDALTATAAAGLRAELLHRRAVAPTEVTSTGAQLLVRLRPAWLRFAPFTLSGLVTVAALAGLAANSIGEADVSADRIRDLAPPLAAVPVTGPVLLGLGTVVLVTALASTIGYVLAFWGFRLERHPAGTLHVTRGLVTHRATSLEERRLRGVELSEPLLLRAVGGARCLAIATGLRLGRGAERGGSTLLPPAPAPVAATVAARVLRHPAPVTAALRRHGTAARRRRFTRAVGVAAAVVVAAAVLAWLGALPPRAAPAGLLAVPVAALLAADRYRSLGHTLAEGHLVARGGSVVRRRCMLAHDGVIGWNLRQSFFQRRAGLATLVATTAAGRQAYRIPDLDLPAALRLAERTAPGLLAPFLADPRPAASDADPEAHPDTGPEARVRGDTAGERQ